MADIVSRLKDADNATHALFDYIFQEAREEIVRLRSRVAELEGRAIPCQAHADGMGGAAVRTGAALPVSPDTLKALAHRTCSRYVHGERPLYQFEAHTLEDFALKLLAAAAEAKLGTHG